MTSSPLSIHPFPARMAPEVALTALDNLERKSATVLDPMTGSGTTLVSAKLRGYHAIGYDSDPLAVLIARAWGSCFPPSRLKKSSQRVLLRAHHLYETGGRCPSYPEGADAETQAFIRFWFDKTNRRQLASLSAAILEETDARLRGLLWCGFSRLIIAKRHGASLARDLSHSRPHRSLKTSSLRPLREFDESIAYIIRRAPFVNCSRSQGKLLVRRGEARRLPLSDGSVSLVLTSPPYLNAIDYLRAHKFSLIWMGWTIGDLSRLRSQTIGNPSALPGTLLTCPGKFGPG